MSEIAIKDLSKSVTIDELNSVVKLCKSEHNRIKKLIESKIEFNEKVFLKRSEGIPDDSKIVLLINSISKQMTKKLIEENREILDNMDHIIEFYNRFSTHEDRLESIDLTTI